MLPENRVPTHPGEILQTQFLEPLKLSGDQLATHLDVPAKLIHRLLSGTEAISPKLAWLLAQAFDTTPEFWVNLQMNHDLVVQRPERVVGSLQVLS